MQDLLKVFSIIVSNLYLKTKNNLNISNVRIILKKSFLGELLCIPSKMKHINNLEIIHYQNSRENIPYISKVHQVEIWLVIRV